VIARTAPAFIGPSRAARLCCRHLRLPRGRGDGSDECRYQRSDGHSEPNHRRQTGYRGL